MKTILTAYSKKGFNLKNHMVMAPMTRSRAIDNIPNDLMATYYGQRAGAGLIITEGTAPAPEGLGYPRIPGIYNEAQINGWKKVTSSVHQYGSKIFLQLMHTGRIGHIDNLPEGATLVGVSNIKAAGQIYTDTAGMQDHSEPVALTTTGIKAIIEGYVSASKNAIEAGFDGVELHAANGYLLEQFLNPNVNNRNDEYGGSIANRARLTIEIAEKVAATIGKEKVGIRFSPFSTLGDLQAYNGDEVHETYTYLAKAMNELDIRYIHISANPTIPQKTFNAIRSAFSNTIILCNGFTAETAEDQLQKGFADLIAFGRSFLATPDFVTRIEKGMELNQLDFATLYTPGEKGYIDYPVL
ncbi:N-ethylmaleimide reductase [Mucilaginibacter frigoritolerans]|uniref:N-ethylmaleimide reductase n=1 Tax=Mucilaginibacter frigoritolerans TaxID=652788 RepID=A0A562U6Z0_9SPHI|nr:alkene reductase [Mucilaginibacter frigoritolerans]TWJ01514.1 N-ethylmaleimide reductase [Mucilaginibacter frigoritolerans]